MILRQRYLQEVQGVLARNPVCAILGPRQCGKTTLAHQIAQQVRNVQFFDLETESARARLTHPELALSSVQGLIVIDEIQRQPGLFATLRPLADRRGTRARFLVLGSASPDLIRGVSESLAGRIGFVDLSGFDLSEVGEAKRDRLWLRGGFPKSYLARSETLSIAWRRDFTRTFLERDIPQLGIRIPAESLRRFWIMLAHYHAQVWNGAELARSLGVTEHTVRRYLDILSATYVVRVLPPWFENLAKRQYKTPKVYIRDSGLLHLLLGVEDREQLVTHPKLGASWEGFALEQILSQARGAEAFFWGTHAGAELDLLLIHRGRRYGVEFKYGSGPVMTKSLHSALSDLGLEAAWIVYPGHDAYPVHEKVSVLPLDEAMRKVASLGFGKRRALKSRTDRQSRG